jgi:hypothetical protein
MRCAAYCVLTLSLHQRHPDHTLAWWIDVIEKLSPPGDRRTE